MQLPETIKTKDGKEHDVKTLPDQVKGMIARVIQWEQDLIGAREEYIKAGAKVDAYTVALNTMHQELDVQISHFSHGKSSRSFQYNTEVN